MSLQDATQRKPYIIGIDTGGTFTDCVVLTETGETIINKSSTTPHDFSQGVIDAIRVTAESSGMTLRELLAKTSMLKHGTTVGTNALITRTGSTVGFITTAGFEDTTLIMRAIGRVDGLSEDEIKHMAAATKPAPLVPKQRIRGVHERVDFEGNVVVPINEPEAREALRWLVEEQQVEAIAVSFLFGWVNAVHEQRIKEIAAEMYPGRDLFLSTAHELVPVVREYGRANTVIINCFLGKTMDRYLNELERKLTGEGFEGLLLIMQANGGIVHRQETTAIGTLSSGPAGGVIGSKFMADMLEHQNVVTTDMGGTSFDVALITDGFWQYANEPVVSRFRIIQPMIDVESIGAGGGTIGRVDPDTGRLLMGPQSAGAAPGPVCYDAGGTEPTTTDVDLALGMIDPSYFLGGRKTLNKAKAEQAIKEKIGDPLGLSVIEAAAGMYDIISSHMGDLIRKQIVRAGHIPEEYALYAFGGAGPVHCAAFAAELGIDRVYIFPSSAVFSAFGAAASDVIHTFVSSYRYFMPCDPTELNARLEEIESRLLGLMDREGFSSGQVEFRRTFYMRYRRQMNELGVVVPTVTYDQANIKDVIDIFERKYESVYGEGSAYTEAGIELISISVDAIGQTPKPTLREYDEANQDPAPAHKGSRQVYFPRDVKQWVETNVFDYTRLRPGNVVKGPAVVETPITTIVIPPDNLGVVDRHMNIMLKI